MAQDEVKKVPCCPELIKDDNCDELFFTRTLNYPFIYGIKGLRLTIQLILGFRLTRCTKGLVMGDPVYSITLLPGEKVRLFTTDRRSKFTYDSETQLSYRSEQISEEKYFMLASQSYFSDLENSQSGTETTSEKGKWNFKGDAEGSLGFFSANASTSASRSYDNSSALDYLYTQSSNMRSAATQAVQATHMAHSISVGEVTTRTHAEGQTEDQYESSSREFKNENNCFAVSYIFYRLNKKQTLKFELVSLDLTISLSDGQKTSNMFQTSFDPKMREEILLEVRKGLNGMGILEKGGEISKELKKKFDFDIEFSLPTPGIIVRGCLDECSTLEEERKRYHKLQNDLLEKQIELLEKSQEYRCCPVAPSITND
jgi:hypothetical protein